jgi:23S rRNA (guanosine2251-2'-O)-methyltransferase
VVGVEYASGSATVSDIPREGLIYGLHAVESALREEPERIERLWIDRNRNDRRAQALTEMARASGIDVQRCTRQELAVRVSDGQHQGVLAERRRARAFNEHDLDELVAAAGLRALVLVLDGVQDPHNLGACLRSAEAAGALAVVAPRDRAVGLTPAVLKVASGAAERVPFVQVTNLARSLRALKEQGLWVIGASGDGDMALFDIDLSGPVALVLGGEGKGLRRLTREHCDRLARIPMQGRVESLNVSVAAGIFLFEILRQRRAR